MIIKIPRPNNRGYILIDHNSPLLKEGIERGRDSLDGKFFTLNCRALGIFRTWWVYDQSLARDIEKSWDNYYYTTGFKTKEDLIQYIDRCVNSEKFDLKVESLLNG